MQAILRLAWQRRCQNGQSRLAEQTFARSPNVYQLSLAPGRSRHRPAAAQDAIKVGAPLPLTGPLSPEGLKQKRGYDLWVETANTKGAIKAGGKTYTVEIVYTDYASNTPRAVQSAERMITDDKVNFL